MSRADFLNSDRAMFASVNNASAVYGFDNDSASGSNPRPKGLFYIRFRRPILSGGQSWRQGHGFFAKAVDLPTVTPQVEELNQYNKKRIVHTGVKYNPISLTFYDTVSGNASQLWNEYARFYFGDFNHANATPWTDDITSSAMSDPEKSGFGYKPRSAGSILTDSLNTQFFFEALEIYQVFGSTYVQTDIINPKINSYEPEGIDYEDLSPAMIRMGLTYEGIVYHNDGQAADLTTNSILSDVFSKEFSGEIYEPKDSGGTRPFLLSNTTGASFIKSVVRDLSTGSSLGSTLVQNLKQTTLQPSGLGGVLSRYGNFSFGNVLTQVLASVPSTTTALGNQPLSRTTNRTSLFSDDGDVDVLGTAFSAIDRKGSGLKLDDATMGVANTLSNGTVQIGRKSGPLYDF